MLSGIQDSSSLSGLFFKRTFPERKEEEDLLLSKRDKKEDSCSISEAAREMLRNEQAKNPNMQSPQTHLENAKLEQAALQTKDEKSQSGELRDLKATESLYESQQSRAEEMLRMQIRNKLNRSNYLFS